MRTLNLDVVHGPAGGVCLAVVFPRSTSEPGAREAAWPPMARHANLADLRSTVEALSAGFPERSVYISSFCAPLQSASGTLLDLLRWSLWRAAAVGEPITTVAAPTQACSRNQDPRPIPLPGHREIEAVIAQVTEHAALLGLASERIEIRPEPFLYGVPSTSAEAVLTRHLAALCESGAPPPECVRAPSEDVIRSLDQLAIAIATTPPDGIALIRLGSVLRREAPSIRLVGSRLANTAIAVSGERIAELDPVARSACVRATFAGVESLVESRGGDFELCEVLLRKWWDRTSNDEPSPAEMALEDDPWALVRGHTLRAHVANHRGDWERAYSALRLAGAAAKREDSIRMDLLNLDIATLMAGAAQNCWPFDKETGRYADWMERARQWLSTQIDVFRGRLLADDKARKNADDVARLDLGPLGREPGGVRRDPVLGRALGTFGRTLAFLGKHDEAVEALLAARARFAAESDRRLNAVFLAQVELDRTRPNTDRLNQLVDLILPRGVRGPGQFLLRIEGGDDGARFELGLLLKAAAQGLDLVGIQREEWLAALDDDAESSLFAILSRRRTHPTALIARRAGEILAPDKKRMAARWFEMSIAVGLAGAGTMQRMATFTRHLSEGGRPRPDDPRGSIFNPCYEYR